MERIICNKTLLLNQRWLRPVHTTAANQHSDHDEDERAGNLVDAPKLEALVRQAALSGSSTNWNCAPFIRHRVVARKSGGFQT